MYILSTPCLEDAADHSQHDQLKLLFMNLKQMSLPLTDKYNFKKFFFLKTAFSYGFFWSEMIPSAPVMCSCTLRGPHTLVGKHYAINKKHFVNSIILLKESRTLQW